MSRRCRFKLLNENQSCLFPTFFFGEYLYCIIFPFLQLAKRQILSLIEVYFHANRQYYIALSNASIFHISRFQTCCVMYSSL